MNGTFLDTSKKWTGSREGRRLHSDTHRVTFGNKICEKSSNIPSAWRTQLVVTYLPLRFLLGVSPTFQTLEGFEYGNFTYLQLGDQVSEALTQL